MTTKDQERKALEQIRKIVNGLGEDSYIGMAFDGIFEVAESNIENDFADGYKTKVASLEKQLDKAAGKLNDKAEEIGNLKKRAEEAEQHYTVVQKTADNWCVKYHEAKDMAVKNWNAFREQEDKNEALALENMKLKAKLYDMMMAAAE